MPTPGTLPNGLPAGIGTPEEATQATAWVRQQPWYKDWMQQNGVAEGPNQQVKLNDNQRASLMATMLQNGIGLNSKYDMVDENGMINEEHHKLKKVAIAAAIAGLAVTGLGAAGIGPLAGALGGTIGGAGMTAEGVELGGGLAPAIGAGAGTAALSAGAVAPLASTAIGTGFIPAIAGGTGLASGAAAAGGTASALTAGSKIASLIGQAGKVGNALSNSGTDANGNAVNAPQNSAYANEADQLAKNRFLETPLNQAGPATDAAAQRNMIRAGLIARMDPNSPALALNGHGLPNLAPSQAGVDFSNSLQTGLSDRMKAGKPLTLSGVPDPTPDELAARAKALDAAGIGSGVNSTLSKVGGYVNTGVKAAQTAQNVYNIGKGIAGLF